MIVTKRQRVEKVLDDENIKLTSFAPDILLSIYNRQRYHPLVQAIPLFLYNQLVQK